ncbi:41730_t:CDS:2 [Gigaspora margarita]|uniref:41730_t:CDS:1 n=1 Tax=Gigaspora margarita TaxID=4874 RepID=A0ABN7VB35_GIGMA|nr:41730_t:CDS:2 [Gigaspora margarita]
MQQSFESKGSPKKYDSYKLIKMFTTAHDHDFDIDHEDNSHTQLFFRNSESNPCFCREIYKIDESNKLYWYNSAALKVVPSKKYLQSSSPQNLSPQTPTFIQPLTPPKSPVSPPKSPGFSLPKSPLFAPKSPLTPPKSPISPMTLWSIDFGDFKCSRILKKSLRPKSFTITHTETGARSTFIYSKNEKLNSNSKKSLTAFVGEVNTPFDKTCDQRYNWILDSNNEKWSLVKANDPERTLVEFRKTQLDNEFLIVFLERAPYGWSPRIADRLSKYLSAKSERMRRGSESSDSTLNSSLIVDNDGADDEKYWHEFVLASTVAIQDEVNPKKRRLWGKSR